MHTTTKEKIIHTALNLFAQKGFTETSVREIAKIVGINASSLYNHFESKFAILDHLLNDYKKYASNLSPAKESWNSLTKNASADDILACMTINFPKGTEEHYLKMVVMLFQEQCRNETVREFMTKDLMLWHERCITNILNRLVEVGALNNNVDIEFWAKLHANVHYASMAQYVLGIEENILEIKREMYDKIFILHGTGGR